MSTVDRVYKLAADRGLSVYQLAKRSDVPYTTIKAAEHRGSQLTVDTLYRLCEGLGITMSEFFDEDAEGVEVAPIGIHNA